MSLQCKTVEYFPDPGYEYPPEPEFCFSKYKKDGNDDDDVDNGDDDDDFDDINSDNKNSKKYNGRSGAKFNMNSGEKYI